jgi:hypothetical protein
VKNHLDYFEMVLSWETLWKADKPKGGSAVRESRWIGTGREENLKLLKKGDRGMTVKPISWVLALLKTPKGGEALEDDQRH